jgi:hypothetical protein
MQQIVKTDDPRIVRPVTEPFAHTLGGTEGHLLRAAALRGDVRPTLTWLAAAKRERRWNDYGFMLMHVGRATPRDLLDALVETTPADADLRLLRAQRSLADTWIACGHTGRDVVTPEGRTQMQIHTGSAAMDCRQAVKLEPYTPAPYAIFVEVATLSPAISPDEGRRAYARAIALHPGDLMAIRNALQLCAQKWHGSHREQLSVARDAAATGGDAIGALFAAHVEIWFYRFAFEQNSTAARDHLADPAVQAELDVRFDRWLTSDYSPTIASPLQIHQAAFWYFMLGDVPRLRRALAATPTIQVDYPWSYLGEPSMIWTQAIQLAR